MYKFDKVNRILRQNRALPVINQRKLYTSARRNCNVQLLTDGMHACLKKILSRVS